MQAPPPTLLLQSLPPSALVGIDLISLTSSPRFQGITAIPPGWHFLFVGATAELSARQGLWFHVPAPGDATTRPQQTGASSLDGTRQPVARADLAETGRPWLAVLRWDPSREELLPATDDAAVLSSLRARLSDPASKLHAGLLPYLQPDPSGGAAEPAAATEFPSLAAHVTPSLLARITAGDDDGSGFWALGTASCAGVDAEAIPGLEGAALEGRALGFLPVDLKRTWREGAVGGERTRGARDRSWALGEVVRWADEAERAGDEGGRGEWGASLLGEMEVAFLAVLALANYSALQQWRRLLELVLTSRSLVPLRPAFFAAFLALLRLQLEHTHVVDGGGLFDVGGDDGAFLRNLVRRFRRALEELGEDGAEGVLGAVEESMAGLEAFLRDRWGWEVGDGWVRRGMLELEDGEMVEVEADGIEAEEERGEYAPVVVEL